MPQRPPKPGDMPWIIPYLVVHDCQASLAYYERAFGFRSNERDIMKDPDGTIMHVQMRFRDGSIMFGPEGAYGCDARTPASTGASPPIALYVYCDDVDALARRAASAGVKATSEPADMFWGDRIATFTDPDGYRWTFATNVAECDLSKMPQMAHSGA